MSSIRGRPPLSVAAISCGGVPAVYAGIGTYAALHFAGIRKNDLYFGASGGAIVSCIRALGFEAPELVRLGDTESFATHVAREGGLLGKWDELKQRISSLLSSDEQVPVLTEEADEDPGVWWTGMLGSRGLGKFIEGMAAQKGFGPGDWPENYVTIATLRDGTPLIFCKDGSYMITLPDPGKGIAERKIKLSHRPPPLPVMVRASGAVPIGLAGLRLEGRICWDGALSPYGYCPVGVLIKHFGVSKENIFACRVGEVYAHRKEGPRTKFLRNVWNGVWGRSYHWGPETAGVLECRPEIQHLDVLSLDPSPDERWLAILIGFHSALEALALANYLDSKQQDTAIRLFGELGYWRDLMPAVKGERQHLADRARAVFSEHGLYD